MTRRVIALPLRPVGAPRVVATWALDTELACYVARHLATHWPETPVWHATRPPDEDARAELWICGREPRPALRIATLWLGPVERQVELLRIDALLWRCTLPIGGRDLVQVVEQVWRQSR
jgi:hypothetical protein